jgi:hypothetical protein
MIRRISIFISSLTINIVLLIIYNAHEKFSFFLRYIII